MNRHRGGERQLTRAQVLAWCDDWSERDRYIVGYALDTALGPDGWRNPDTAYGPYVYSPPSNGYVAVNARERKFDWGPSEGLSGHPLAAGSSSGLDGAEVWLRPVIIERSLVVWPHGRAGYMRGLQDHPLFDFEDGDFREYSYAMWVHLSPYRRRRAGTAERAEQTESLCPRCRVSLPTTGVCDLCDE